MENLNQKQIQAYFSNNTKPHYRTILTIAYVLFSFYCIGDSSWILLAVGSVVMFGISFAMSAAGLVCEYSGKDIDKMFFELKETKLKELKKGVKKADLKDSFAIFGVGSYNEKS